MAWSVECGVVVECSVAGGKPEKGRRGKGKKTVLRYYYYKKNPTNHNEWLPHKIVIWCCYVITHSCFLSSSFPKHYFFIVCFSFSFGNEWMRRTQKELGFELFVAPPATHSTAPLTPPHAVGVRLGGWNWSTDGWVASLSWMLDAGSAGLTGKGICKNKSKHWICGEGGQWGSEHQATFNQVSEC